MTKAIQKHSPSPTEFSKSFLVLIVFSKTNSKNYPLVLQMARGADSFNDFGPTDKPIHFVGFGKTIPQAELARGILNQIKEWKGVQMIAHGQAIKSPWRGLEVLNCYVTALKCNDYKAHCHVVVDSPEDREKYSGIASISLSISPNGKVHDDIELVDKYIFPCRLISGYRDVVDPGHPSKYEDQVQAAGIRHGVDWCPFFKYQDFKKIGTTIK